MSVGSFALRLPRQKCRGIAGGVRPLSDFCPLVYSQVNMKEHSANAIRAALKALLAELGKIPKLPQEGHWEYHRTADSGWSGKLVPKLSFMGLDVTHGRVFDKLGEELEPALAKDYPDYLKAVGTETVTAVLQPATILVQLALEAEKRFGTFAVADAEIDALLAEVSAFFDRETVSLRLYAPALNLFGPADTPPVAFPEGVRLRPITDDECTRFYGGNPIFRMRSTNMQLGFPFFVFVKELRTEKVIGTHEVKGDSVSKRFQEELDSCVLALATFKDSGAVGYDGIWVTSSEFTLGAAFADRHMFGNEHVPLSRYDLTAEEAPQIEAHAKLFDGMHSTLEMASQRLVDSARRTKPRDTIVDAVIGLESILLSNLEDRTELRFRFSLNYAALFPKEEREVAFRTAKDLYDLRSRIAHGGSPEDKVKINKKELTLHDAAVLARSVLRKTIAIFSSNSRTPDYMKEGYWLSKELGL